MLTLGVEVIETIFVASAKFILWVSIDIDPNSDLSSIFEAKLSLSDHMFSSGWSGNLIWPRATYRQNTVLKL